MLFCPSIPFVKYGKLRRVIFVLCQSCAPTARSRFNSAFISLSDVHVKSWLLNLQIEIAFAGLAAKIVVSARTITGGPESGNDFIVYPATGALEIASAHRHEAAEALQ